MSKMPALRPAIKPRHWRFTVLVGVFSVLLVSALVTLVFQRRLDVEPEVVVATPVIPLASAPEPKSIPPAAVTASPETMEGLAKLASAGDAKACFELGERYRIGKGCLRDEESALRWYSKAGEAADDLLLLKLADVLQDWGYSNRAVDLYERAAFAGNHDAQLRLASRKSGDVVETYAWLNICASWGNAASIVALDKLEKESQPDTIAHGQARSREILKAIESGKLTK